MSARCAGATVFEDIGGLMANSSADFCVVAAVNDDEVLANNLASSPLFEDGIELVCLRGFTSAGNAYNHGLSITGAGVVVFAHQDVYLPRNWLEIIREAIAVLEARDPTWAVIGVYGVDATGLHVGRCWSSGLRRELGSYFTGAREVRSVDELVIILRRSAGLRFDEALPGFHLYGTDIVQTALANDRSAYVVHAPVVHNSRPVMTLAGAYSRAYRYMQAKWHDRLPLHTAVVSVSRPGYPLIRSVFRGVLRRLIRSNQRDLANAPRSGRVIAEELGYDQKVGIPP